MPTPVPWFTKEEKAGDVDLQLGASQDWDWKTGRFHGFVDRDDYMLAVRAELCRRRGNYASARLPSSVASSLVTQTSMREARRRQELLVYLQGRLQSRRVKCRIVAENVVKEPIHQLDDQSFRDSEMLMNCADDQRLQALYSVNAAIVSLTNEFRLPSSLLEKNRGLSRIFGINFAPSAHSYPSAKDPILFWNQEPPSPPSKTPLPPSSSLPSATPLSSSAFPFQLKRGRGDRASEEAELARRAAREERALYKWQVVDHWLRMQDPEKPSILTILKSAGTPLPSIVQWRRETLSAAAAAAAALAAGTASTAATANGVSGGVASPSGESSSAVSAVSALSLSADSAASRISSLNNPEPNPPVGDSLRGPAPGSLPGSLVSSLSPLAGMLQKRPAKPSTTKLAAAASDVKSPVLGLSISSAHARSGQQSPVKEWARASHSGAALRRIQTVNDEDLEAGRAAGEYGDNEDMEEDLDEGAEDVMTDGGLARIGSSRSRGRGTRGESRSDARDDSTYGFSDLPLYSNPLAFLEVKQPILACKSLFPSFAAPTTNAMKFKKGLSTVKQRRIASGATSANSPSAAELVRQRLNNQFLPESNHGASYGARAPFHHHQTNHDKYNGPIPHAQHQWRPSAAPQPIGTDGFPKPSAQTSCHPPGQGHSSGQGHPSGQGLPSVQSLGYLTSPSSYHRDWQPMRQPVNQPVNQPFRGLVRAPLGEPVGKPQREPVRHSITPIIRQAPQREVISRNSPDEGEGGPGSMAAPQQAFYTPAISSLVYNAVGVPYQRLISSSRPVSPQPLPLREAFDYEHHPAIDAEPLDSRHNAPSLPMEDLVLTEDFVPIEGLVPMAEMVSRNGEEYGNGATP